MMLRAYALLMPGCGSCWASGMRRSRRCAPCLAELDELRKQVAELQAQIADLAARLRQNSKNSSRPPSQDGPGKAAPKSLRMKTGRKAGPAGRAAGRDDAAE
jgi:hypothetical protein